MKGIGSLTTLAVLFGFPGHALAQDRAFELENGTNAAVVAIYASPHGANNWRSDLLDYKPFETWDEEGARDTQTLANVRVKKMLGDYQAPAIDEGVREAIDAYVARRKSEMPDAFM